MNKRSEKKKLKTYHQILVMSTDGNLDGNYRVGRKSAVNECNLDAALTTGGVGFPFSSMMFHSFMNCIFLSQVMCVAAMCLLMIVAQLSVKNEAS